MEEWRPLTKILAETLKELQSERHEVYTPRLLLSKLTQRLPQFGGGDQHDSHELLRHLLEAVREEDLRRYQVVILDKLGKNCLSLEKINAHSLRKLQVSVKKLIRRLLKEIKEKLSDFTVRKRPTCCCLQNKSLKAY